jgi:hypothetical protein
MSCRNFRRNTLCADVRPVLDNLKTCASEGGQGVMTRSFQKIGCDTASMRQLGQRFINAIALVPSPDALRAAAIHQATGQALAAVITTGIRKGVYRFASHAEMNRHAEAALAHAVAINVRRRAGRA